MTEKTQNTPATIPEQPDAKPPLRKSMPVVIALVAILAILGIANVTSLLRGNKKTAPTSALPMRPASPSAQQVSSFETQQQLQAQHDAEEKQRQQELLAAMQQLQSAETPGPESASAAPMTAAQRDAIYGGSSNAPQRTSNVSEAQAEAKQRALARERQKQDAINSDTMAIDFAHTGEPATGASPNPQTVAVLAERSESPSSAKSEEGITAGGAQSQKSSNATVAS
jgi:type IV secretion system protein VirB10